MSILKSIQEGQRANVNKLVKKFVVRTCPHCLSEYTLGVDGVETGCDSCEGVVRLSNGMIDYGAMNMETFNHD
jgi:hypothetical protein